jgi:hypothetical protein
VNFFISIRNLRQTIGARAATGPTSEVAHAATAGEEFRRARKAQIRAHVERAVPPITPERACHRRTGVDAVTFNYRTGTHRGNRFWREDEDTGFTNVNVDWKRQFDSPGHQVGVNLQYTRGLENERAELQFTFTDIFNDFGLQREVNGNGFRALYENLLETQVATLTLRVRF